MEHTELCASIGALIEKLGDDLSIVPGFDSLYQNPIRANLIEAERWAHAECLSAVMATRPAGRHRRAEPGLKARVKSALRLWGGSTQRVWLWSVPAADGHEVHSGFALTWARAMAQVDRCLRIETELMATKEEGYAQRWARRGRHLRSAEETARPDAGTAPGVPSGDLGAPSIRGDVGGPPVVHPQPPARVGLTPMAAPAARRERPVVPSGGLSPGSGSALARLDHRQMLDEWGAELERIMEEAA